MRTVNLNVVNLVCLNDRQGQFVNLVNVAVAISHSLCSRISDFIAGITRKMMPAKRWQAAPCPAGARTGRYLTAANAGRSYLSRHTSTVREHCGQGCSERFSTSLLASAS